MRIANKYILTLLFITSSLTLFADDFFDDFSDDLSTAASSIEINGEVNLGTRGYFSDDIMEEEADIVTDGLLTIKYQGTVADITLKTKVTSETVILDEAFTNVYFEYFNIEAGLLKTVWGKGDKLHVVDLLNPTDYGSYFISDYLESKIAQPILKFNVPLGTEGLLELAYIPVFEGDSIPRTGHWVPGAVSEMETVLTTLVENGAKTAYSQAYSSAYTTAKTEGATDVEAYGAATGAAMAASLKVLQNGQDISTYYPNTNNLSYGQGGVRLTGSFSGFDCGALYYYGYVKQPTFNMTDFKFEYEKMQMAGVELGKALGGFNLRAEGAYYIMDDSDDSLNYLGGFDYNLPLHNLNINLQIKGNYLIDSDTDNTNLLVGKLSDTFDHEKTSLSVTGVYYLEDESFMIKPEFTRAIGDTLVLEVVSGIFSGDDNTILGQFDDSDYISMNFKYMF